MVRELMPREDGKDTRKVDIISQTKFANLFAITKKQLIYNKKDN